MKKQYMCPAVKEQKVKMLLMAQFSANDIDTISVYTDAPQEPGNALSRRNTIWEDEE